MFFRSLFYERTILSYLEKVQKCPIHVQTEIATRVANFVNLARTVSDDLLVEFAVAAREQLDHAVAEGATEMDPLWAAPAISEAWCNAMLGLQKGNLEPSSTIAIIIAIDVFAMKRGGDRKDDPPR